MTREEPVETLDLNAEVLTQYFMGDADPIGSRHISKLIYDTLPDNAHSSNILIAMVAQIGEFFSRHHTPPELAALCVGKLTHRAMMAILEEKSRNSVKQ